MTCDHSFRPKSHFESLFMRHVWLKETSLWSPSSILFPLVGYSIIKNTSYMSICRFKTAKWNQLALSRFRVGFEALNLSLLQFCFYVWQAFMKFWFCWRGRCYTFCKTNTWNCNMFSFAHDGFGLSYGWKKEYQKQLDRILTSRSAIEVIPMPTAALISIKSALNTNSSKFVMLFIPKIDNGIESDPHRHVSQFRALHISSFS